MNNKGWVVVAIAGSVAGVRSIIGATALAVLIFSGGLAAGLPAGIAVLLFSGALVGSVVALRSSYTGTVAEPQYGPAAVLGLLGASLVAATSAGASPESTLLTVLVAVGLSTILTGLVFYLLGRLSLGKLVRFLPYPLIGGFLAGAGWLLVNGGISVSTDGHVKGVTDLFDPALMLRWVPGLVFAAVLIGLLRRFTHFLIVPGMLFGAIGLFYLVLLVIDVSPSQAQAEGWLLGPFPDERAWRPLVMLQAGEVQWGALFGELPKFVTITAVSIVALLLNATGIELATKSDMDINRELRTAGIANLVCGAGGGVVSFHSLSASVLAHHLGANSRVVGIISGGFCLAALIFGISVLSYFPKPLLGGLLLFMGFAFLIEWVYDAYFRLNKTDYGIILIIILTVSIFGYMEGVGVGVVLAIFIFVFNYSRVNVIRNVLSGVDYHSNVDRSAAEREMLETGGDQVYILKLSGFLFFGTAHGIVDAVYRRAEDENRTPVKYLVLDFRRIDGVDSSALSSFLKLKDFCHRMGIALVFCEISDKTWETQFVRAGFDRASEGATYRRFDTTDLALEWCENELIRAAGAAVGAPQTIETTLRQHWPEDVPLQGILAALERMEFKAGDYLIRQGEHATELYFIESGKAAVCLELPGGKTVRLRVVQGGAMVGEIASYLNQARSAAVIAEEPVVAYRLSLNELHKSLQLSAEVEAAFHRYVAISLGRRLNDTNVLVEKLN